MKKTWKKAASLTLVLALMLSLMSGMAINAAAAGSGPEVTVDWKASGVTLTPQEVDGKIAKFALSFTGTANAQHVVFLLNGENNNRPTESNIRYIDQKAAASNGKVEMTIYPDVLPGGQYAVYASAASGFKLLATFEVKSTQPEVVNKTLNEGAEYSFAGTTMTVQYTSACAVMIEHADGTYTRLTAKANTSGGYDFDVSAAQSGEKIVIVLKGDINGDGKLMGPEVAQIKAAQLSKATFTDFQMKVADLNGDGKLMGPEVAQIKAAQLSKGKLNW